MSQPTSNHYEIMQLSSNASDETIEKMFRFMASQHHPDAGGDRKHFEQLVRAFEVLRTPASRAAYDVSLNKQNENNSRLAEHSKQAGPDTAIRHELLCLFYARRRQNIGAPALGAITIEKMMNLPAEVLEFHTWYFKEKGWIKRAENGGYCITAEGVDQVESRELKMAEHLRITAAASTPNSGAITMSYAS